MEALTEIIYACEKGSPAAQRKLYNHFAKPMFNVSMRLVNHRETAEDILQESFITAFEKIGALQEPKAFPGWFKRIVVNKSLNLVKQQKWEIDTLADKDIKDEPAIDNAILQYKINDVLDAVEKLPTGYRIVFNLFLIEGWNHQEISDELNISISTSKSQLNRAKHKVRGMLLNKKRYE